MPDDDPSAPRPLLRPPGPPVGPPPPPDVLPPPGNPKGSRYDPGLRAPPPEMLPGNPKGSRYDAGPVRSRTALGIVALLAVAAVIGALIARFT